MGVSLSRKRAVVIVAAALSCFGVPGPSVAVAGTPQYPDLKTLAPSALMLGTVIVGEQPHHVVRFTNEVLNAGEGPLELHGKPRALDGRSDVSQRIYQSPAGFRDAPVGEFVYHPEHEHFHFGDFARYELWTAASYRRALQSGFRSGTPLARSEKVGFCVLDFRHAQTDRGPPAPVYQTCTPILEGLSVGWSDVYAWFLDDQWVDVGTTPLADGAYVLRSVADPSNLLFESEGKRDEDRESEYANAAATGFSIEDGVLLAE